MVKMCDWAIARRRDATREGADPQSVTYGLIKFRPYCDYFYIVKTSLTTAGRLFKLIAVRDGKVAVLAGTPPVPQEK
jgi:hypothetical protein